MPIPAKPKICLDGISLILTCPIKNMHHHRVDAAVHLTLSISMACIYMRIYARHKAKAANPSHQACCLILALTPGKHPLKQCWGTFIWKNDALLWLAGMWEVQILSKSPTQKRGSAPFSPTNPDAHLN